MIIRGGIQRLFSSASSSIIAFINNARGAFTHPAYVSGRLYAPNLASLTTTNTAGFVAADTLYAYPLDIAAPVTIASLGLRTSATSAGNLSSAKVGIYANDPTTGVPTSLLGQRNTGVATTGSNANLTFALDANVTLQPGRYWLVSKHTFTTTAPLFALGNLAAPSAYTNGGASISAIFSATPIYGWSGTDAFANNMPATFPAATAITSSGVLPAVLFGVA
ncbi:hypothetical protein UFOVP826_47 [uncultured Caudovirales phage]|uniref:Uncharacterized protein n=1 Tax=uncultured Caudovirales phage TaxID=2100421 RepID=A0A6J5NZM9_9CAUD|nr:hypothetical protein UFOVP826_47 [uncultured Caudovirales phage]